MDYGIISEWYLIKFKEIREGFLVEVLLKLKFEGWVNVKILRD